MTHRRPISDLTIAVLVVAALTAIRVIALFASDFNLQGDEAQYWTWAQDLAFGYYSKPPMVAWMIATTTAVCGDGEACVRVGSPLLHGITSLILFGVGRSFYDSRVGMWAAVLHATLPAVSFSAALVSTDVPLLLFWSIALLAVARLRGGGGTAWVVVLGISVGFGLLSKYAMAYFVACAIMVVIVDRPTRDALSGWRGPLALALGVALLMPNVLWNLANGWATVGHTADNANWQGPLLHPDRMLEFAGAQFGLIGPLLLVVFLIAIVGAFRRGAGAEDRALALFSAPVLAAITVQALLSRAHANWAATAFPAAVVLVAAVLTRNRWPWVRNFSLWLHGAFALIFYLEVAGIAGMPSFVSNDPFAKVRGWDDLGREVRQRLSDGRYTAVLADDRMITATLKYYLPEREIPVVIWWDGSAPGNHYELTAPITLENGKRVLYVTSAGRPPGVISRFAEVRDEGEALISAGEKRERHFWFYSLDDFLGLPSAVVGKSHAP